jgi:cobalt-zinc-cadmium efflux system outer membrane protein
MGPASGPAPLTMAALVERVVGESPVHMASEAEAAALRARLRQEAALSNPELDLEYENQGWSGSTGGATELTAMYRQPISMGRKRASARMHLAAAGREADAITAETLAGLVAEAKRRFVGALAARDKVELVRESLALAGEAHELVVARVEAQDLPACEAQRSSAELAMAKARLAEAEAEAARARRSLASCWGGRAEEVGELVGTLDVPVATPVADSLGARPERSPQVAVARAGEGAAAELVRLEKARGVPDLTIGLGYHGAERFGQNGLAVNLAIPLPFFDRNQGGIDEARALARRAAFLRRDAEARWQAAVDAARAELTAQWQRHDALRREVLPNLEMALASVSAAFKEGKVTAMELLEVRRQLLAARLQRLAAAQRFFHAQVEIEYLTGALTGGFREGEQ